MIKISVILATKNEEKNIEVCIKSILKQNMPRDNYEIILVDKNSTDKTKEIAKKYLQYVYNFPPLKKKVNIKSFRGSQLNFGVNKAKGKIIFFPDTDMTFDGKLMEEVSDLILNHDLEALYIPETVIGKGLLGKIRNFERSFYNQTSIDAVRFVKRDFYLKIGGFDEENIVFGPDDWDFNLTVNKNTNKIGITKSCLFHHEENLTIFKYFKKKAKYISTLEPYIRKWGKNNPAIRKQFGFFYRYIGIFVEKGKWKKIISNPVLSLLAFTLKISLGVMYLSKKFFSKE